MKKALLTLMCIAAMMAAGTSLKAQEVTIVLMPGWTWISVPSTDTMDFSTALGSFVPMEGDRIKSQYGMAEYHNGQWYGTISQFYPGYGYMYKSTRTMPVMLTFNVQQPAPQVVVTTSEPMMITAISAMGGGEVTVSDGTYIIVKGLCWAAHENPMTNDDSFEEAESGVGSFSLSMTGLNISTTYYVRAYAVTANGTVYGDQKTFTTRDGIPSVTTADVTNIMAESATCGGTVTDNCGLTVIARGVCWSTSPTPTLDDSHTTNGSGNGSFSSSITGLNLSTTYYVRAYATTSAGIGYGEQVSFTTRNGIPTVTTSEIANVQGASATCGGNITDDGGGLTIIARGVCWSVSPSPTLADSHTTDGSGPGSYTSYINGLNLNTTYYVRAYVTNSIVTVYGNQQSFTTYDGQNWVDLGLPSGLLWATCNVGADSPEDYGDYFAWGETTPKDTYDWSTYQYCNGSYNTLTKYCNNSSYGYNGFMDNLTTLLPEDDAATANWGDGWCMPTKEEWEELYNNTTCTWTTQNGINGRLFTASNGNSLFLPAAGYRYHSSLNSAGSHGDYWSSSLIPDYLDGAWGFYFSSGNYGMYSSYPIYGQSVRPVRSGAQSTSFVIDATANPVEGGVVSGGGSYQVGAECMLTATANEGYTFTNWTENDEVVSVDATYTFTVNADRTLVANFTSNGGSGGDHEYVDLGLPSGLLWATCNVGAEAPEDYGDYFTWGETQPKDTYNWSTYQYCMGSNTTLTKYCDNSSYGYNGFTDNLTTLLPEDDAATANWGSDWRMPTKEEWQELYQNTTVTWITQNDVNGRLFTASNGNSLFLPAAGDRLDSSLYFAGGSGYYWSSSLITDDGPLDAWIFGFDSGCYYMHFDNRSYGHSVRPVCSSGQNNAPTGAINGKFTINADGEQVYFSQGNLQYQASTNTWRFADNQYDYIGSTNSNISSTYSGWIDLFGWGTSGYHDVNDPYNVNYQPWSTASSQVNSSYNYYGYGPSTNMTDSNLTGTSANYDWGVYNPISNGGNQTNQWRTLTQPEWNYVFNTRITTSGIRYAKANVNNVNGVILLPDDWNASTYSLNSTNTYNASFSSNTLTASQWSTLEQAGAVFLPAAGLRYGTSVNGVGSSGFYWSASYDNSNFARYVYFNNDSGLNTGYDSNRCGGQSVRLVRVAE